MYVIFAIKKEYFEKNKGKLLAALKDNFEHIDYKEIPELPDQVLVDGYGNRLKYFNVFNELRRKKILAGPIVGVPHGEYGELLFWNVIKQENVKTIDDNKKNITLCIPSNFYDFKQLLHWYEINRSLPFDEL
jgi:poly-D-alanine transfer protein DltD